MILSPQHEAIVAALEARLVEFTRQSVTRKNMRQIKIPKKTRSTFLMKWHRFQRNAFGRSHYVLLEP